MVLSDLISENEFLYRAIKRSKPCWLDEGKPTPAMYKDDGNSVDRDAGREFEEIIEFMRNGKLFPRVKGIVEISARDCLRIETKVTADPNDDNPYHANIWLNSDDIRMQNLRALQLADASEVVFLDEEMMWTV